MRTQIFTAFVTGSLLTVCATGAQAQTRYLQPVFASATAEYDIAYDPSGFPFLLDVYRPTGDTATNRPLVVLIHGGGFANFGPVQRRAENMVSMAQELARRGYVAASIEYRTRSFTGISPYFPCNYDTGTTNSCHASVFAAATDAQYDVQKATAWLQANATRFGIDPQRVATLGESAGAITALNVVNRPNASGVHSNVKAAVALAGAMIDTQQRTGAPPMLLIHGETDTTIDHVEGREILRRAQALGNYAELRSSCSLGHYLPTANVVPWVVPFLYERIAPGGTAAQRLGQWFGATNKSPLTFAGQVQTDPSKALVGDFDGNDRDDVLFHGLNAACDKAWLSETATTVGSTFAIRTLPNGIDENERPTVGDFNGDGRSDVFVYGVGSAVDEVWWGQASNFTVGTVVLGSDYTSLVGDFDGDLRDDILWLGDSPAVWYGNTNNSFTAVSISAFWWAFRPVVGDFNGDSLDDILWYGPGTTGDVIWWGGANRTFSNGTLPALDSDYQSRTGDFDGNGTTDVFWLGASPKLWYGQTSGVFDERAVNAFYWAFNVTTANFDGDTRSDVFWQSVSPGDDQLWYGTTTRGTFTGVLAPRMDGPVKPLHGDFNGDGRSDWFWTAQ
jgi:acetyl esterase/lipase